MPPSFLAYCSHIAIHTAMWIETIATRHPPTPPTIMKQASFFKGSQEPIAKKNKELREYLRLNRLRHARKLERAFMKAALAEYASA